MKTIKVIDLHAGQRIEGDTHALISVTKGPTATHIIREDGTEAVLSNWEGVPGYGANSTITIDRSN